MAQRIQKESPIYGTARVARMVFHEPETQPHLHRVRDPKDTGGVARATNGLVSARIAHTFELLLWENGTVRKISVTHIGKSACLVLAMATVSLSSTPAHAGGFGRALSKAGDDVLDAFNSAANPQTAQKVYKPQLNYNPPAPAPGGATVWSNGASGTINPSLTQRSLSDVFKSAAGQ